jgi:hypothetical protein
MEEAPAMAELREYRVTVNGHDTVMNLSEEDAARLGGTPVEGTTEPDAEPAAKAASVANKSRTAARNKSAD